MFFSFGDQLIFGLISVLQDSFAISTFDKNAFTLEKVSSNEVQDFIWKNNQQIKNGLIITEREEFAEQNAPQITVSMSNGNFKNMSFDQYLDSIVENGIQVGEIIGGSAEFDFVIRCAAESTSQRKKLTDRTIANILVNRDMFRPFYGFIVNNVRMSAYGENQYVPNDKRIYWQDITVNCYGEWSTEIRYLFDNTKLSGTGRFGTSVAKLGQIVLEPQMYRTVIKSNLSLLWNVSHTV